MKAFLILSAILLSQAQPPLTAPDNNPIACGIKTTVGFVEGVQRFPDRESSCMQKLDAIREYSNDMSDAILNCLLFNFAECSNWSAAYEDLTASVS